jgi:hypothetical protein
MQHGSSMGKPTSVAISQQRAAAAAASNSSLGNKRLRVDLTAIIWWIKH